MNEAEWISCSSPQTMLWFLQGKASERKFRLFLVGCCKAMFDEMPDAHLKKPVRVAERFADGEVGIKKIAHARESVARSTNMYRRQHRWPLNPSHYGLFLANLALSDSTIDSVLMSLSYGSFPGWAYEIDRHEGITQYQVEQQASLLRDIFGNPFRPVQLDPAWNAGTVGKLAQTIYEERRFADMPILADALEEAGCTETAILEHCREPGPHVRGCWVVDSLLGKN